MQVKARLGHGAFEGVDEQQAAVGHVEHAFHFTAEVRVTRGVDDVDLGVSIIDRNVFRKYGDATLAFEIVVVEHEFAGLLIGTEEISRQQHFVHERSLTVVYVGDDGDVANVLHLGEC